MTHTRYIKGILLVATFIFCGIMNAAPVTKRPPLPVVDNGSPIIGGAHERSEQSRKAQPATAPQKTATAPQKPAIHENSDKGPAHVPSKGSVNKTVPATVDTKRPAPYAPAKPAPTSQEHAAPKSTPRQTPAAKPAAAYKPVPLTFPEISHKTRKYYDLKKIAARYNFHVVEGKDHDLRVLTLVTQRKETLVFTEKKPLFLIGNLHASLSYPVVYEKGRYLLEKTDYSEFIEPLLRTTLLPRRKIKNIVIDAGHGGKDQGASSGKILEKNLNLLMARKIAAILRIRGYQVSMTRTGDKTITLQERCDFATKKKPDLFLSIHCNSAEDASISGIEVFLANPPDVPSFGTTNIGKKGAATPFQQTSALWAFYTQKALLNATKATDRGIKRKQFKVIIDTPSPALLVELGFISNKDELQNLQKKDYQDKLADAICDSIDKLSKTLKPQNK